MTADPADTSRSCQSVSLKRLVQNSSLFGVGVQFDEKK